MQVRAQVRVAGALACQQRHVLSAVPRDSGVVRSAAIRSSIGGPQRCSVSRPVHRAREQGLHQRRVPTQAYNPSTGAGDAQMEIEKHPLTAVLLAVASACAGAFAFGYHVAVVNGPLEAIAADLGFAANKAMQGTVVSSTLLGAAVSSLAGGGLADSLGRRKTLLLACVMMFVGPLLCAYAQGFDQMVAGRFLTGVAIGLSSTVVPTYISEVAPTYKRGQLGTLNQLVICLGILAVLLVSVALPATQWRTFFMLALIPAGLLLLGMLVSPESPRWQQSQPGQQDLAADTAKKLWGPYGEVELGLATTAGGAPSPQQEAGWGDLLGARYRKGVLMGAILFLIQQAAGINALVYFSTAVFRQAGVASDTLASAAVGATNVLGTLIAASLIEGSGRKQLLVGSYLGQAVAMLVMAAAFALPALKAYSGTLAVVGTLAYILTFALGAGPVTALIISELNPGEIRGRAMAVAMTSHWVCNVALGQTFMAAVTQYGLSSVYAVFGTVALLGALYIRAKVPETKGKSFGEIAQALKAA